MSQSSRRIMVAFIASMVIVLVIGGDAFRPTPSLSQLWPVEMGAGVVALASVSTLVGRFIEWLPGALRQRR